MRRVPVSFTLAVALLMAKEVAADDARPRTSSLSWVRLPGADACVATQALAKRVEARLGRSVFTSAAVADVSVEGHVEPASSQAPRSGFHAALTLRDAKGALLGSRELTRPDASCESLTEPLVLVIAVMIDPDASLGMKPPDVALAPPSPTVVVVEKPVYVVAAAPPPPPPAPAWRIDVGAAAITTLGLIPAANVGMAASGLLEPPGLFPLEGFGAVWFDDETYEASNSASFEFGYVGGGLCPAHYRADRLRLYGCAIGELGALASHVSCGRVAPTPTDCANRLTVGRRSERGAEVAGKSGRRARVRSCAGALRLADESARRFPKGDNRQEAEVIAITALLATHRRAEAEARANAFRVIYPGSTHLRRIDTLLAQPP